jgi:hypothetical protein
MGEAYFEADYIEETAVVLARRLYGSLSCLMTSRPVTIGDASTPLSSEPSAVERSDSFDALSGLFIEAFTHALQLKSQLILAQHKYKLVYFRPGDLFNSDRMRRNTDTVGPVRTKKHGKRPVTARASTASVDTPIKFCLFPALYPVLDERDVLDDSFEGDFRHCLVNHRKFITDDLAVSEQGSAPIVKAVVLV